MFYISFIGQAVVTEMMKSPASIPNFGNGNQHTETSSQKIEPPVAKKKKVEPCFVDKCV